MPNVYARESSLSNVIGRSDYISNPKRQEDILLHKKDMHHSWQEYVAFEKAHKKSANENIQARESVVALPNELADDLKKLEYFCDRLAEKMYGNHRDYEYAVHWNHTRTNLHVHFIYSERERSPEKKAKIYKRDIWADPKTGRTCSKNYPNAILRCKKGEIQRDKQGNIKYNTATFSIKDKTYSRKSWIETQRQLIKEVFEEFHQEISLFNPQTQLPQKKLTKGASEAYIAYAKKYNQSVQLYNRQTAVIEKAELLVDEMNQMTDEFSKNEKEMEVLQQKIDRQSRVRQLFSSNSSQKARLTARKEQLVSSLSNYGNQLKTLFKGVLTKDLHFDYAPVKEWVSIFTKQLTALKEKHKELRKLLFAQRTFTKAKQWFAQENKRKSPPVIEIPLTKKLNQYEKQAQQLNAQRSRNRKERDSGLSR